MIRKEGKPTEASTCGQLEEIGYLGSSLHLMTLPNNTLSSYVPGAPSLTHTVRSIHTNCFASFRNGDNGREWWAAAIGPVSMAVLNGQFQRSTGTGMGGCRIHGSIAPIAQQRYLHWDIESQSIRHFEMGSTGFLIRLVEFSNQCSF